MVGVFQRFGRQSIGKNPNSSEPRQEVEEPGLHHPSCKPIPCVFCWRSARCGCGKLFTPSPLYSHIVPPPCPPPTGAEERFPGALAITLSRKKEWVQRHRPPDPRPAETS